MTRRAEVDRAIATTRAYMAAHDGEPAHDGDMVVAIGARALVTEVWRLVRIGKLDARSSAGDQALELRNNLDPDWDPLESVTIDPPINIVVHDQPTATFEQGYAAGLEDGRRSR